MYDIMYELGEAAVRPGEKGPRHKGILIFLLKIYLHYHKLSWLVLLLLQKECIGLVSNSRGFPRPQRLAGMTINGSLNLW